LLHVTLLAQNLEEGLRVLDNMWMLACPTHHIAIPQDSMVYTVLKQLNPRQKANTSQYTMDVTFKTGVQMMLL
jgi:hypothetical protein